MPRKPQFVLKQKDYGELIRKYKCEAVMQYSDFARQVGLQIWKTTLVIRKGKPVFLVTPLEEVDDEE